MTIGNKIIGKDVFIIAEAGVNHNGHEELAMRLIDAAVAAGADAVKFQMFDPDELVSAQTAKADYQRVRSEDNESQKEMLGKLTLSQEQFNALAKYAEGHNIIFMATPFDASSAEFLTGIGMPVIKVPSGEITNEPLLKKLCMLKKPLIISTGMATMEEIVEAVDIPKAAGIPFALLHCVSAYPAPIAEVNLRVMRRMRKIFSVPVGYSDHTDGMDIALAAAALGASIIEKHLTLDRTMPGPDHQASLEPNAFAEMVSGIRRIERALGSEDKKPQPSERNTAEVARRSVVANHSIAAGKVLSPADVAIKRPGTGIAPKFINQVLGKKARTLIKEGQAVTWEMLE